MLRARRRLSSTTTACRKLTAKDKTRLELTADLIKNGPKDRVYKIEGHADQQTGTAAGNKRVAENRAKNVYDFLVKCGVNPKQLTYEGWATSLMFTRTTRRPTARLSSSNRSGSSSLKNAPDWGAFFVDMGWRRCGERMGERGRWRPAKKGVFRCFLSGGGWSVFGSADDDGVDQLHSGPPVDLLLERFALVEENRSAPRSTESGHGGCAFRAAIRWSVPLHGLRRFRAHVSGSFPSATLAAT